MKVLEEDVEKSLQREESRLDSEEQSYPDDVQKVVQELKSKHNVRASFMASPTLLTWKIFQIEVEQLRKRTSEMEIKHARVAHDVGCLDSLSDYETHPLPIRSFTRRSANWKHL